MENDTLKNAPDTIQSVIDLVERTRDPFVIAGVPAVLKPKGTEIELYHNLLPAPQRLNQIVDLHTPQSFIDYVNRYATESTVIFCDLRAGQFRAVMDYHTSPTVPGWCTHRASYTCPVTPEWGKWKLSDGEWMTQESFALFIEGNQEEILHPSGAEMLEIALTLQAKTNVDFSSGIRLDNGQIQLQYKEDIQGSAGVAGQLTIPSTIKIGLQLFEGGKGYEMEARFRYRVKDGNLAMKYDLIRPHKAHEAAVESIYQSIDEGAGLVQIVRGVNT